MVGKRNADAIQKILFLKGLGSAFKVFHSPLAAKIYILKGIMPPKHLFNSVDGMHNQISGSCLLISGVFIYSNSTQTSVLSVMVLLVHGYYTNVSIFMIY